ncbi:hypothetical protein NP511_22105 (plasmid) [Natrinema thermotolerans]|uniref:Uncharacterized protein n=1 Tax=Natrinema thermotolerans TaxID=121872 RepID=A0AAF0T134_9EURY|nr:hypothetical protein [Natrinema thermotolerans]WMT10291.1 hypothetical protein NP511_22105 [Natrinema thermotolerans]
MTDPDQTQIDPFRELNRYDDRTEDWRSSTVYEPPRRTVANGWAKFHADRGCGSDRVRYVEGSGSVASSDTYDYDLRCWSCGYRVDEDAVLFVGGEWFREHGWRHFGRPVDDLSIPADRVLDLGPNPDQNELIRALNLTRIERKASVFGLSFGNESYDDCEDCGQETYLLFDGRCRMCYDGEWTDRMQQTLDAAERSIRERNGSFIHRLGDQIDPLSIKDRAFEDKILWRRHDAEPVPKLVEVTQCLTDDSDGHWEYVLTDIAHTREWRYHEDDLADCFWDTGLYNGDRDDRIRDVWERVKE